jgi:hypothetical protein
MDANIDPLAPEKPLKGRRKAKKDERDGGGDEGSKKRRCISSACVPCRKRKSKVRYLCCPHICAYLLGILWRPALTVSRAV